MAWFGPSCDAVRSISGQSNRTVSVARSQCAAGFDGTDVSALDRDGAASMVGVPESGSGRTASLSAAISISAITSAFGVSPPDRLQLGLGLNGLSAPPSLGTLLEQRSRWHAGRRLRYAALTATGWRVGGVDSNVNPFRCRVTALYSRVAQIRDVDAVTPCPVCGQAMRTEIGRPSSSIRLRAWTATFTSVARHVIPNPSG